MLLLAPLLLAVAAAAPERPVEAPLDRIASAKAYSHYLQAKQAELKSDWRSALEELQSAVAFDSASASLRMALADAYARTGYLGRAEAEARRALESDPGGPTGAEAHLFLGKAAVARHQGPEAARELREAIRLQSQIAKGKPPEEAVYDPEAWRLLAQVELEAGDEGAAARALDDLATRLPAEGAESLRDLGHMYLERHDLARAESYLRKAVQQDRHDVEAWRRLAEVEEARHRPEEERKAWESLLREDPEDVEGLLALGRLALRAGDPTSARAWFGQVLVVSRDEPGSRASVAFAWLDARRAPEAMQVLEEGLVAFPKEPRLLYAKGLVLQDQRRWEESAEAFAAVAGDDGDLVASARASQSYSLVHLGRNAEALQVLGPALAARPRDVRLLSARAFVLDRSGRAAESAEALEQELRARKGEVGGPPAELYEALSGSLQQCGRSAEAVRLLKAAVAERPREEALRYTLAVAQDKGGEPEAAIATMQALLEIDPEHADAMNFVGYSWAERGVRLDEAERLLSRALDLKPDNAFFLDSLGWIEFQKGNYVRAVALLEHADSLTEPEPTILEHLGDAYRRTRRPADAARAYRRALAAFEEGADPEGPTQRTEIERKLRELTEVRPARR